MAVEALCTVFTVPNIGQHRLDVLYLHGAPDRPALGCYEVSYDREEVGQVWHDQDADPWLALMAKAARLVAEVTVDEEFGIIGLLDAALEAITLAESLDQARGIAHAALNREQCHGEGVR